MYVESCNPRICATGRESKEEALCSVLETTAKHFLFVKLCRVWTVIWFSMNKNLFWLSTFQQIVNISQCLYTHWIWSRVLSPQVLRILSDVMNTSSHKTRWKDPGSEPEHLPQSRWDEVSRRSAPNPCITQIQGFANRSWWSREYVLRSNWPWYVTILCAWALQFASFFDLGCLSDQG